MAKLTKNQKVVKAKIEEGKSYPVKLSEEYEICDLNSFFEKNWRNRR